MSDRLAVMDEGRVRQIGTPRDVYESPEHAFVADFLGAANLLDAQAFGADRAGCKVRLGDHDLVAGAGDSDVRGPVKLVIRPERVVVAARDSVQGDGENCVPGVIERLVFQGPVTQILVALAGGASLQALVANQGQHTLSAGSDVTARLPAAALRALPVDASAPATASVDG